MTVTRSIRLAGSNADTQEYTLAPGLVQYVQAVYVELDNTAGGDARPTLTISEQSGVVIAKKRQGEAIAAGDTGSATWALRLTDEGGASTATGFIKYDFDNVGEWLHIQTTGPGGAFPMWLDDVAGEIRISSDDGGGGGQITLRSPFIRADTAGVSFRLLDSGETFFDCAGAASWDFVGFEQDVTGETVFTSTSDFTIDALSIQLDGPVDQHNGSSSFEMQAGGTFKVKDHLGNTIFQVDEDGSLHGKTGKTLTFDL